MGSVLHGCVDRNNMAFALLAWVICSAGVLILELSNQMEVLLKQWVVTEVQIQSRPVVSINQIIIHVMDNIDVSTHELHLKAEDCLIDAVI
jgi:hypothetical protein